MLKNLLQKAKAALAPAPAWRGSSGETVAQRKARQERESAKVEAIPCAVYDFKPVARRVRKAERVGRRLALGTKPRKRHGALSFRPLGSPLTLRVRRNLRWGHTWIAKKIAATRNAPKQAA